MLAAIWIWRIAVSVIFVAISCAAALSADLLVAMPNWPSGQAAANIIKYSLKQKLDLGADVREMGSMTAFAGMDSGEVDVYPEVWLPNLDSLVKKYVDGRKTVDLSPKGVSATQGICVTHETADRLSSMQAARRQAASWTPKVMSNPLSLSDCHRTRVGKGPGRKA